MEPAGTSPSTELHHLGDSHMDSMTNSLQNINDETSRITTSMESADVTPSASPGETGRYNTATIADFNGNISLKNLTSRLTTLVYQTILKMSMTRTATLHTPQIQRGRTHTP